MPKRNPEKAMQMLDMLLEFFGEEGQRWIVDEWNDGQGNRCLVSAMAHLRGIMKLKGDTAGHYLRAALPPREGLPFSYWGIAYFNDSCDSYDEIRPVIIKARELAQAEFDKQHDRQQGYARSRRDSALVHIEGEETR